MWIACQPEKSQLSNLSTINATFLDNFKLQSQSLSNFRTSHHIYMDQSTHLVDFKHFSNKSWGRWLKYIWTES